ncbi:hypothetical protein ALC60_06343 [Trachymyrmex zeteki]|uniref:Uncharacterized protein n=1 Tax=Mycetomoellerius zeteki TaxID=64791 RepID=A0A151X2U8_9HYME|nr:hypothetical protein ALC60_06343 [Trachymyrmex zeteki]
MEVYSLRSHSDSNLNIMINAYRWQKHPQLMPEAISMLSKHRQYVSLITADDYNVESDSCFRAIPFQSHWINGDCLSSILTGIIGPTCVNIRISGRLNSPRV